MNTFSELELSSVLKVNLARHGYVTPTPVQAQSIPPAMAGRDVIATAQTGTGKTVAFLVPLIENLINNKSEKPGIDAVILSPTRELAIQIHESFAKLASGTDIRAAVVVGGLSEQTQLRAIRGGARVIVATPGRLADFLERKLVKLSAARVLVLDEADRMLDMGFLPTIRRILGELPPTRQTLFFSATIESSVTHLINAHLKNAVRIAVGATTKIADNLDLRFFEVEQDRKLNLLSSILNSEQGSFLVFARTKHGTDRLADNLTRVGVKAVRIHGGRTQSQRNQALKEFKDGRVRIMVATDVAARGIHVDGIAHVVNYDLPQVPEDFLHRAGRTGRAGAVGIASTFGTRSERGDIRKIERALNITLTRCPVTPDMVQEPVHSAKVTMIPSPEVRREKSSKSFRPAGKAANFRTRRRKEEAAG